MSGDVLVGRRLGGGDGAVGPGARIEGKVSVGLGHRVEDTTVDEADLVAVVGLVGPAVLHVLDGAVDRHRDLDDVEVVGGVAGVAAEGPAVRMPSLTMVVRSRQRARAVL